MNHPSPVRPEGHPITFTIVEAAILHLIEAGKTPSEPNVRGLLGGSPNTLHPLITRWFAERAPDVLAGRISVVQSSDLPKAAHDLIAELREDARKTADATLAEAQEKAVSEAQAARDALAEIQAREVALAKKAEVIESVLPAMKSDLDLAKAELAAARAVAESMANERRQADTAREAAESMARDAERREERAQDALNAANDAAAAIRADLAAAQVETANAKAESSKRQAEIERISAEATASMTSLRESIDEIKTAHLREVQGMRATQTDAAARWAEQKAALERQVAELTKRTDELVDREKAIAARLSDLSRTAEAESEKIKRLTAERDVAIARAETAERESAARGNDDKTDVVARLDRIMSKLEAADENKRG